MGARRIDPGPPLPRGGAAPRGTGLRCGRPAADADRAPGAKHPSRREAHLLPIVRVVRGPGPRHKVRPAGQLRTRPCTSRPRSTGDPSAGRRRLGEPERGHAWAAARITRHQANRSLLFHVDPVSTQAPSWAREAALAGRTSRSGGRCRCKQAERQRARLDQNFHHGRLRWAFPTRSASRS